MALKKRVRINIRLPEPLVAWAQGYAEYSEITFTKVVELGLMKLQADVELLKRKPRNGKGTSVHR